MKILIAPDSFKESLSAIEVARNIETGIKRIMPEAECILVPMADGGEGTVKSLVEATRGHIVTARVHDPLMRKIESFYGILGDGKTAIIEMAAASGLGCLAEHEKDPYYTTTYGTGELIMDAVQKGCSDIIIGIGGSATTDGGTGMATAVGVKFLDKDGNELPHGGKYLLEIESIDTRNINPKLREIKFTVASDVTNPLCGTEGASRIYGPQKGAFPEQVEVLDRGLSHYGDLIEKLAGCPIKTIPGSGAAGGLGAGLMAFLDAALKPGFDVVRELTGLDGIMKKVDLVITGEGKIDYQTRYGKTPFGIARMANEYKKPVIAFAGTIGEKTEVLYENGFDCILPILDKPASLEYALQQAPALLRNAAERMMRIFYLAGNQQAK